LVEEIAKLAIGARRKVDLASYSSHPVLGVGENEEALTLLEPARAGQACPIAP
jgi:hypothetical protein